MLAAPLMVPHKRGLIVSTIAWDRGLYLGNLFYDVAKAAIGRMIFGMAKELRNHGVGAVAAAPTACPSAPGPAWRPPGSRSA